MTRDNMLELISEGRTDLVFELLKLPDWQEGRQTRPINLIAWPVYYGDVTALRAAIEIGRALTGMNLNEQFNSAAFLAIGRYAIF